MQLPQEIWTQILKLKDHEETIKELIEKIKTFYDILDHYSSRTEFERGEKHEDELAELFYEYKDIFEKIVF